MDDSEPPNHEESTPSLDERIENSMHLLVEKERKLAKETGRDHYSHKLYSYWREHPIRRIPVSLLMFAYYKARGKI